jgi:catechol 2,3-dioxygenase-like lactoylglutathione lyase family enzyme
MTQILRTRSVLAVPSLQVSVPFYRDKLGMRVDLETPGWVFLSRDGFAVMLGECPDAIPPHALGDHSYFAYVTVAGIDALYAELMGRDLDILKPLVDEPWGMREFALRTVDGHRIMFGQSC